MGEEEEEEEEEEERGGRKPAETDKNVPDAVAVSTN